MFLFQGGGFQIHLKFSGVCIIDDNYISYINPPKYPMIITKTFCRKSDCGTCCKPYSDFNVLFTGPTSSPSYQSMIHGFDTARFGKNSAQNSMLARLYDRSIRVRLPGLFPGANCQVREGNSPKSSAEIFPKNKKLKKKLWERCLTVLKPFASVPLCFIRNFRKILPLIEGKGKSVWMGIVIYNHI